MDRAARIRRRGRPAGQRGLTVWIELLFPAWILLLSIDILRTGLRQSPGAAEAAIGARA
jgi:hypothetical protein